MVARMSYQMVLMSGKQGSGKSTLQKVLIELAGDYYGFTRAYCVNFADALYFLHDAILEIMADEFGVARQTPKDGLLLQLLGTDWGRKVYGPNIWVNILRNRVEKIVENLSDERTLIVVGDCRFKNEFDAFPESCRVRVMAPEGVRKTRTNSWRDNTNHPSEIDLDDYEYMSRFDFVFNTDPADIAYAAPHFAAHTILSRLTKIEPLP